MDDKGKLCCCGRWTYCIRDICDACRYEGNYGRPQRMKAERARRMAAMSIKDIFRSYAVFDAQGRHTNGTDKESNHHYGDAYESILTGASRERVGEGLTSCWGTKSIREDVKLMMEVGIAGGASLLAWRDIFPNATCVGLDIMPDARDNHQHEERLEFHVGDATERIACDMAVAGRQFDLIVEDATHRLPDTLLMLYWLWPHVRPGGLYIVEEWDSVGGTRNTIRSLWPNAQIIGTCGPTGQDEPLVVFRKPL